MPSVTAGVPPCMQPNEGGLEILLIYVTGLSASTATLSTPRLLYVVLEVGDRAIVTTPLYITTILVVIGNRVTYTQGDCN